MGGGRGHDECGAGLRAAGLADPGAASAPVSDLARFALVPALTVGVVTWRETTGLGRLAEAPGLREAVEASVDLARTLLDEYAIVLAKQAETWATGAERRLPGPVYGWVETDQSGGVATGGAVVDPDPRLSGLSGAGRLDDPPLLYHVIGLADGGSLIAVRFLEPELVARLHAAGQGAAGLRQLGLYYEQILRGRALLVAAAVLFFSVLLALLVSGGLTDRLVSPLADLVAATRRVTEGDREFIVDTRAVDEVRELEEAFNEMTAQLAHGEARLRHSERLAAWQGIARRLAHEIKNPLTPIHLAVHRARQRTEDPVIVDSLGAIEEETRNLQRLAEEFSTLGRLPAPRLRPVHAAAVAREVAALYLPEDVSFSVDGDALIRADEGQLRQVFSNLFKNAVEATGGSGRLSLRITGTGLVVRLEIDDDGPGLPEGADRIFEPEFTTRSSGTGLGLAIVRRIVEDHEGSIHAVPAPGGGARFSIEWPAAAGEDRDV